MKLRMKLSLLFGLGFMIFAVNLLIGHTGKANAQLSLEESFCGHMSRLPTDYGQVHVLTTLQVRNTATGLTETFNAGGANVNITLTTIDRHPTNHFGTTVYPSVNPVLRNIGGSLYTVASVCRVVCGHSWYGDYYLDWNVTGTGEPDELAFLKAVRPGTWSAGSWSTVIGATTFRNGILERGIMAYYVDWTPPPPPPSGGIDIANCSQIKGWAYDPRRSWGQVNVHIYFNGSAGDPGAIGWDIGLANGSSPGHGSEWNGFDVNPIGQPWLVPILRDGNSHSAYFYGVSPSGNFYIGQANIPACPYTFDVTPNAPTVNNGSVSFIATNIGDGESRYNNAGNINTPITFLTEIWIQGQPILDSQNFSGIIGPSSTWSEDIDTSGLPIPVNSTVCARLTVNPSAGVTGGWVTRGPLFSAVQCNIKSANPYPLVYSGDVIAGGTFKKTDGTCDPPLPTKPGQIRTHSRVNGLLQKGASGQYGVFARDVIDLDSSLIGPKNFISNSSKSPNGGSKTYTFANNPGNYGNFGRTNCMTDYYAEFFDSVTSTSGGGNVNIASLTTGVHHYTGDINLRSPAGPAMVVSDRKIILLVDGNITIEKNISFNYPSLSQVPFLLVVAKGDITVNTGVDNISGIFVAQPNSVGGGGSISTCDETAQNNFYDNCNNKLTVTGSFIAKKINWRRTAGDLFDSTADTDRDTNGASEVIDISPSLYYSSPPVRPKSNKWQYDSIRNLSPVF